MLHPRSVIKALYYGFRWRVKTALGLPQAPRSPVLESGLPQAVERYRRICRTLFPHLPRDLPEFFRAAEIGCGDCLAAADMMLGLGADHIHLVDQTTMPITPLHREALLKTLAADLPNRGTILLPDDPPKLNPAVCTFHSGLLEKVGLPEPVDLVFSFDVLEHVEDLRGFFSACYRFLKPGGYSIHKFDLSGHEFFEDPMPPLDFQTYPTWFYKLLFPKYRRATGNFADQFFNSMEAGGFEILNVIPLRKADPAYLKAIRPKLRQEARTRNDSILELLDLVVVTRRS